MVILYIDDHIIHETCIPWRRGKDWTWPELFFFFFFGACTCPAVTKPLLWTFWVDYFEPFCWFLLCTAAVIMTNWREEESFSLYETCAFASWHNSWTYFILSSLFPVISMVDDGVYDEYLVRAVVLIVHVARVCLFATNRVVDHFYSICSSCALWWLSWMIINPTRVDFENQVGPSTVRIAKCEYILTPYTQCESFGQQSSTNAEHSELSPTF